MVFKPKKNEIVSAFVIWLVKVTRQVLYSLLDKMKTQWTVAQLLGIQGGPIKK